MPKLLHATFLLPVQPSPLLRLVPEFSSLHFLVEALDRVEVALLRIGIGETLLVVQFPLGPFLAGEVVVHRIQGFAGSLFRLDRSAWCDDCREVSLPDSEVLTCLVPLSVGVAGTTAVLIYPPQDRVRHEAG